MIGPMKWNCDCGAENADDKQWCAYCSKARRWNSPMRYLSLAMLLTACAPNSSYTTLPYQPPKTAEVLSAINIGLCTVADSTPEARETFNLLSSVSPSTADKIFGGILSGVSVLGKALACYMKDMATARAQTGEIDAAQRSDREVMQGRAGSCDPASQAYNLSVCKDPRKLAAFLLLKYERAGRIVINETQ